MNINPEEPEWSERDRFVLSKGHGYCSYYAVLSERGYYGEPVKDFKLRCLNSPFQGHPVQGYVKGIDSTSGSLGNGLSIAGGMAKASKINKNSYNVYCITGDGELEEGSIWEGVNFGASQKLDNLFVFVDRNGWQSGDSVEAILGMNNVEDRFQAFGWDTQVIEGHDFEELERALDKAKTIKNKPHVIVCDDIKGKGVSFMENNNAWHKKTPTEEEYLIAKRELSAEF